MDYQYQLPSGLHVCTKIEPIRSRLSFLVAEKRGNNYHYLSLTEFDGLLDCIEYLGLNLEDSGDTIAVALLDDFATFPLLREEYDKQSGKWSSTVSPLQLYCSKKSVDVDEILDDLGILRLKGELSNE